MDQTRDRPREGNGRHKLGRIRRCSAKRLMESVWDGHVDAELDFLSVLLSLLEDAPASVHPLGRRREVAQGDAR